MMLRARASAAAIAYIQKATTMISMPHSMGAAIEGDRVMETDAPWCRVFHHETEK